MSNQSSIFLFFALVENIKYLNREIHHCNLKGACYKIGNGIKVNLWKELRLLNLPARLPTAKENVDISHWKKVIDLRLSDGSDWNRSLIKIYALRNQQRQSCNWDGRTL